MNSKRLPILVMACALVALASAAFAAPVPEYAAAFGLGFDPSYLVAFAPAGMTAFTEGNYAGEYLISEANGTLSREAGTLASGNNLAAGAVVGKVTLGAATTAFAGTGNGAITMDATTPVLAGAKVGAYTATCITAAANGGTFRVEDPDGLVLGDVAVAATFSDDIKFVIADGATDFIVGDKFTITVAAGSGKYGELALTANDGRATAAGVLFDAVDASAADKSAVFHVRHCEVAASKLTWPAGITADQKTAAIAQLAAVGIIVR